MFNVVTGGRDAATEFLSDRLATGRNAEGWEVDQAARRDASLACLRDRRAGQILGSDLTEAELAGDKQAAGRPVNYGWFGVGH